METARTILNKQFFHQVINFLTNTFIRIKYYLPFHLIILSIAISKHN